jgi:hypothetical protein
MLWTTVFAPLVRHGLTYGGGLLVAAGYLDAGQSEILAGAGLAVAGVLWSVLEKRAGWMR